MMIFNLTAKLFEFLLVLNLAVFVDSFNSPAFHGNPVVKREGPACRGRPLRIILPERQAQITPEITQPASGATTIGWKASSRPT